MTVVMPYDPEVVRPKRSWPPEYRRKVLAQIHVAEASGDSGAVGEIWRREGSDSSLVSEWCHQRDRGAVAVLSDKPAGRQPDDRREGEVARLRTRVAELASANELIGGQGEVSALWQERSRHSAGRSVAELNTRSEALAGRLGLTRACGAFGAPPRSWHHRRQAAEGRLPVQPPAEPTPPPLPAWTLPEAGRDRVRGPLCWPRFCDLAPAQVFDAPLDEGISLCSESTTCPIPRERDLSREPRHGYRRHSHAPPVLRAIGPNQVGTWDSSYLRGPARGLWFSRYVVVVDFLSRTIGAWCLDPVESDKLARRSLDIAYGWEGIRPEQSTIHSDRGAPRISRALADLFETLGVARSRSRPQTSNDNPSSEATLETAAGRSDYPDRFETTDEARAWWGSFVHCCNVCATRLTPPPSLGSTTDSPQPLLHEPPPGSTSQPTAREPVGTRREPRDRFPSEEEG
ncbi:MAG: hypothetical protein M0035_17975 [Actinomycetota bacterium]|jgi:transposase InsO family protein|nr:hypothetical protein [Actinomycetota bacterium]